MFIWTMPMFYNNTFGITDIKICIKINEIVSLEWQGWNIKKIKQNMYLQLKNPQLLACFWHAGCFIYVPENKTWATYYRNTILIGGTSWNYPMAFFLTKSLKLLRLVVISIPLLLVTKVTKPSRVQIMVE